MVDSNAREEAGGGGGFGVRGPDFPRNQPPVRPYARRVLGTGRAQAGGGAAVHHPRGRSPPTPPAGPRPVRRPFLPQGPAGRRPAPARPPARGPGSPHLRREDLSAQPGGRARSARTPKKVFRTTPSAPARPHARGACAPRAPRRGCAGVSRRGRARQARGGPTSPTVRVRACAAGPGAQGRAEVDVGRAGRATAPLSTRGPLSREGAETTSYRCQGRGRGGGCGGTSHSAVDAGTADPGVFSGGCLADLYGDFV